MFNSTRFKTFRTIFSVIVITSVATAPLAFAHDEHGKSDAAGEKSVTGEIVDMMCYVDHNAIGESHGQSCGAKCIKGGGPVGIVSDGKAYLVVGEHKPMNDQLAEYCGKTVTLKGKLADRGGIAMLENAEIVKK
ncbi:MAG TPA: hypothetical protein VEP30_13795 [Chthoniobacterales bacterium]|nr:hypothetical protein [Chthoniobacterales bacterium]